MSQRPSKFQEVIYKHVMMKSRPSLLINARAGSGKTTTLEQASKLIPKSERTVFLAFNKSISEELKGRMPSYVEVNTLHSFGYRMIMRRFGDVFLQKNKIFSIAIKMFTEFKKDFSKGFEVHEDDKFKYCGKVSKIVDFIRMYQEYDVDGISDILDKNSIIIYDREIHHALRVVKKSDMKFRTSKVIDFTDMIHIPVSMKIEIIKYQNIFVDESQDLSRAQQMLISKMIDKRSTRIIAVGDENQAIYGFSGSDSESFKNMRTLIDGMIELPLSVCYRCSKNIVREAQKIVPEIEAFGGAEVGEIPRTGYEDEIKGDCMVICRNVKPLVEMFFYLLDRQIKVGIMGRDIANEIKSAISNKSINNMLTMKRVFKAEKLKLIVKLKGFGVLNPMKNEQYVRLSEMHYVSQILMERFDNKKRLEDFLDKYFTNDRIEGVMLSTIHKSKGLEHDKVFFLNPELIPSQFAYSSEQLQQERNLLYVGITRAKSELIYVRGFAYERPKSEEDEEN